MKTKHIFIPVLDVGDLFPFAIKSGKNLQKSFEEQDKAKSALISFINLLEKQWKESVYYMGMDIIGERSYERFIFEKGGFFEIMVEAPAALNAHFVQEKRAEQFLIALKKTLQSILPKKPLTRMFIDNIQIQTEEDSSLLVEQWHRMQEIRKLKK